MGTKKVNVEIDGVAYRATVVPVGALPARGRKKTTKKRAAKKAAARPRAMANPMSRPPLAPPGTPRSQWYFWTEEWQAGEREADAAYREGRVRRFKSVKEALAALRRPYAGR